MNKAQLVDAIASESKITKADATRALDAFMNATTKALKKGDRVALVGFGSLGGVGFGSFGGALLVPGAEAVVGVVVGVI